MFNDAVCTTKVVQNISDCKHLIEITLMRAENVAQVSEFSIPQTFA